MGDTGEIRSYSGWCGSKERDIYGSIIKERLQGVLGEWRSREEDESDSGLMMIP